MRGSYPTLGIVLLLLLVPSVLAVERIIDIELSLKDNTISHSSIAANLYDEGAAPANMPGGWVAELLDAQGNVLHVEFFDLGTNVVYENDKEELAGFSVPESDITLHLPYYDSATAVVISDSDLKELYKIVLEDITQNEDAPGAVDVEPQLQQDTIHEAKGPSVRVGVMIIVLAVILGLVAFIMMTGAKKKK